MPSKGHRTPLTLKVDTPLMAPNGARIVGTLETVLVMDPMTVVRDKAGEVCFVYTGRPSKVYDECSELVLRAPEGGGPPEMVYQDEHGDEWLESQLVPMPEPDAEGEP